METLIQYGWNSFFEDHHNKNQQSIDSSWKTGRIISIKGTVYHIITDNAEMEAELSGRVLFGSDEGKLPYTGDWVYFLDYGNMGYIVDVFPRRNVLSRKKPGKATEQQIMAANIDYGLIVQGLDRDFNVMRIERYIVQMMACEIEPIIILNKDDLINDHEPFLSEILKLGRNITVHFCSTFTGSGIAALYNDILKPGKTYMLIGSSGAGKSSLINCFRHNNNVRINTLSGSTNKGKHTTTNRELFRLDNGSLIMDTPGMREFGLTSDGETTGRSFFPAIEKYHDKCRFKDCTHTGESGCAVVQAVNDGMLDQKTYSSYQKLLREQQHFSTNEVERRKKDKQFGKIVKEYKGFKNKLGL